MRINSLADAFVKPTPKAPPVAVKTIKQQRAVDFEKAVRARGIRAKHEYLEVERLSAEPRGNEIDLRR